MKLGRRRNYHEGQAAIRHYAEEVEKGIKKLSVLPSPSPAHSSAQPRAQPSPAGLHAASALSPSQNISRLHHRNVKTFQLSFLSNSLEILFCTEEYSGRVGGEDMVMGGCYLGEWMEIEIILDE